MKNVNQADWVGADAERQKTPPRIFNPQPAKVDEKIQLRSELRALTSRVPSSVANGSVQQVAAWKACLAAAIKVLGSQRSTGQQLRAAISSMGRYR